MGGKAVCARLLALALLAWTGAATPRARADELQLSVWNALYGRVDPLGLEDWLFVGVQDRLYRRANVALRDNWLYAAAAFKLSPSSIKMGPHLELQPLSILNLAFTAELGRWFGVFTTFQSFGSPLDDWSDTALFRRAQLGDLYATTAIHLGFAPRLQAQLGPIVVRDQLSIDWWTAQLRPGDTVFYDGTADAPLAPNSIVISNDADLLYAFSRRKIYLGLHHTLVQPFYPDSAYRPGEPHVNPNGQQRLTAIGVWTFFNRGGTRLTVVAQAGWYLQHRYRTGADTPAGEPYLLGGLVIDSRWPIY